MVVLRGEGPSSLLQVWFRRAWRELGIHRSEYEKVCKTDVQKWEEEKNNKRFAE